jgi:outer membrane protein TolC
MLQKNPLRPRLGGVALCLALSACATQHYDPQPLDAASGAQALAARSLDSAELKRTIHAPAWPPPAWNLEMLTLAAFHFNPDLEAARARLAAAQAGVTTAGQRPNPTLQLPLQRAQNPRDGESPWTLGLALDIPVETHGKRDARIAAATHRAAAARLEVAGTAWHLRSQLREQLLLVANLTEKSRLLEQQADLDRELVAMLDARLRAGYVPARDLNQQRLALIQSEHDLLDARKALGAARIQAAALVGLRPGALDGVELDLTAFGRPDPPLPVPELQVQALRNRADVREALESYEASQAALQLDVARQYPDVHLGPGYTFDQGVRKPGFDFSGIELPVFNRNEGPIAEARARRQEAAANVTRAQARAWSELDAGLADYRLARAALREAGRQLDVQRGQLAGARHAFELGEQDRLALALDRKTELAARLAVLAASAQVQQALGRIEDAVQRPLPLNDPP